MTSASSRSFLYAFSITWWGKQWRQQQHHTLVRRDRRVDSQAGPDKVHPRDQRPHKVRSRDQRPESSKPGQGAFPDEQLMANVPAALITRMLLPSKPVIWEVDAS
jgi:hypothetical protein